MRTATVGLSHPILFVFDFSNKAFSVPEFDPSAAASANSTGVSVRTVADVDGDVTVHIARRLSGISAKGNQVFAGKIQTPSRKVAVVTAENQVLVEASVREPVAQIRVVVDDVEHPTTIWVEAR
jgi:hypothetical protein